MGYRNFVLKAMTSGIKAALSLSGKDMKAKRMVQLAKEFTPIIDVDTKYGNISFLGSDFLPIFRAESFHTKEPSTLEWIDSFTDGSLFWDIGANVGVYSLYAALKPGIKVIAFEPAGINFFMLVRNIELNKKYDTVYSLCIALSDSTEISTLYMPNTKIGKTGHTIGEPVDITGNPTDTVFKQGTIGYTVDDLVLDNKIPFPNYIKIDVDGIESKILKGASKTLKDDRLKSVLVEIDARNTDNKKEIKSIMKGAGMKLVKIGEGLNYIFSR